MYDGAGMESIPWDKPGRHIELREAYSMLYMKGEVAQLRHKIADLMVRL